MGQGQEVTGSIRRGNAVWLQGPRLPGARMIPISMTNILPKKINRSSNEWVFLEHFSFTLLIYSIPVSAYAVQHFRHISPLFKRLNNDPLQAEDRKNERVILDNLMPKYTNVTLLVYFSNKLAQNFERHAVSTFTYICSSRLRCECLADRGGTSASFLPFFEVPVFVICYMLHDSSNERVAHLVSRQCRTSFVVGQRTPYFKLLSCEKGANSRRTIQPSLMYVGLQSSAYIYYLFLKPSWMVVITVKGRVQYILRLWDSVSLNNQPTAPSCVILHMSLASHFGLGELRHRDIPF